MAAVEWPSIVGELCERCRLRDNARVQDLWLNRAGRSWPEGLRVLGVDFTSRPTRRKPITIAVGQRQGARVRLLQLLALSDAAAFEDWLAQPGPWVGAFDFPFGLPRELVEHLGWPTDWPALMDHYAALTRAEIRATFAAFCQARPAGSKFAHRATDRRAGSSPSMKWVHPPVAYMLHAGVSALRRAGVHLPGLQAGDPSRVALEGYPGMLARELIGARSYKSDKASGQTSQRWIARKDLIEALVQGRGRLGLRLQLSSPQHDALAADAAGDRLDAVLCLMQAAWALDQPRWGWPPQVDGLEGWILTA